MNKLIVEIKQDTDYRMILKLNEPVILSLMSGFHEKVANKR